MHIVTCFALRKLLDTDCRLYKQMYVGQLSPDPSARAAIACARFAWRTRAGITIAMTTSESGADVDRHDLRYTAARPSPGPTMSLDLVPVRLSGNLV